MAQHKDGSERARIVVGVDGSASSQDAMCWALRQAELTGAAVEVVTAWQWPVAMAWSPPSDVDLEASARHVLDAALADATESSAPTVDVRPRIEEGIAARVLLDAARGADLLVLGSRGHGGFVGALLGSVTQHCVQHAACPVVVVREARASARDR